jgi:polyhydroxybutyrate depolymerase
MLLALVISCYADSITGAGESGNYKPGTAAHSAVVGDLTRTFLLHVPPHARTSAGIQVPYPLVIVLHGSAGDGGAIEEASKMDSLADASSFLVAYPNGTGGNFGLYPSDWNAGTCCGGAARDNVDDLGFIRALITKLAINIPVDPRHIYIAGFSSGGYMAYYAGCKLSPLIAAIAVVSGSLAYDACAPAKAMPLFAVHGTDDPEVSYDESAPDPPAASIKLADGLPPSVQYWTVINKCTGGTVTATSANVTRTHFTPCSVAEVDFYSIQGGTHGWPSGPDDPGSQPPMNEMKASVLISAFFTRHIR